jgi:hypothetical protein
LPALTTEQNAALATTRADVLLALAMLHPDQVKDPLRTYQVSKRGNALRVMAQALWRGKRGARVNTTSPGIVIAPLAKDELTGRGKGCRRMIERCPVAQACPTRSEPSRRTSSVRMARSSLAATSLSTVA